MESVDPVNLASVNKSFSKPGDYAGVLERLARRNVYGITSFIFGLDNDSRGVAGRTLGEIRRWPPGLPVFGQITPFPGTPLYDRLKAEGRLTRPEHWLEFSAFRMAHTPLRMSVEEVQEEVRKAWVESYSPATTAGALERLKNEPLPYRISHFAARLFFRGIYLPQRGVWAWLRLLFAHRRALAGLIADAFRRRGGGRLEFETGPKGASSPRSASPESGPAVSAR
jgi:hypothetical protein